MQLLIHAWDTCFWHQIPHVSLISSPLWLLWQFFCENQPHGNFFEFIFIFCRCHLTYWKICNMANASAAMVLITPDKQVHVFHEEGFQLFVSCHPDSKIHGVNVGPTWGRQDPAGPHVGHTNLAIWAVSKTVHTFFMLFFQNPASKGLITDNYVICHC